MKNKLLLLIPFLLLIAICTYAVFIGFTPKNTDDVSVQSIMQDIYWVSNLNSMAVSTKGDGTKFLPNEEGWKSYTPTVTMDGTACSSYVRGTTIRYKQIGKTICLQGTIIFGWSASGSGGTYVKITLPINGKSGLSQYGVGSTYSSFGGVATPTMKAGFGIIVSGEEDKVRLGYGTSSWFAAGDAPSGYGFVWVANGCYEIN